MHPFDIAVSLVREGISSTAATIARRRLDTARAQNLLDIKTQNERAEKQMVRKTNNCPEKKLLGCRYVSRAIRLRTSFCKSHMRYFAHYLMGGLHSGAVLFKFQSAKYTARGT
jgi:hypothetical protein